MNSTDQKTFTIYPISLNEFCSVRITKISHGLFDPTRKTRGLPQALGNDN